MVAADQEVRRDAREVSVNVSADDRQSVVDLDDVIHLISRGLAFE